MFLERKVTRRTRTAGKAAGGTSKARGAGAGGGKAAGAQAATQPLTVLTGQGLQGVRAGEVWGCVEESVEKGRRRVINTWRKACRASKAMRCR